MFSCDSTEDEPVPEVTVAGCTDPQASNYQANATEEDCSCLYDGFTAVGSPPTNVEKNVFLEEFTGEWCGWCVDATVRVEQIIADNPEEYLLWPFTKETSSKIVLPLTCLISFPYNHFLQVL